MAETSKKHFDSIAGNYHEEIPGHIRDHLIEKWWALVGRHFPKNGRVLDIGCGDGRNVKFLRDKGLNVAGVDASKGLIENGVMRWPELRGRISEGDALRLDFRSGSYDLVYMIGVLHHIYSRDDQKRALNEALRVVREGGKVIIRESNIRNPFFRVFWNYVFPVTARIDRFGGENWLPVSFYGKNEFKVEEVKYFTFLPNITPGGIMSAAAKVESWLEKSFIRSFAAHYTVVLKK